MLKQATKRASMDARTFVDNAPMHLVDDFVQLLMDHNLFSYHVKVASHEQPDVNYKPKFKDSLIAAILKNTSVDMSTCFFEYLLKDATKKAEASELKS